MQALNSLLSGQHSKADSSEATADSGDSDQLTKPDSKALQQVLQRSEVIDVLLTSVYSASDGSNSGI